MLFYLLDVAVGPMIVVIGFVFLILFVLITLLLFFFAKLIKNKKKNIK